MAKLSARGRVEWLRVQNGDQQMSYMSDGAVLFNRRDLVTGRLDGWKVAGTWDRVRTSLPVLRAHVVAHGWTIVKGDGPRAGSMAATAKVLVGEVR